MHTLSCAWLHGTCHETRTHERHTQTFSPLGVLPQDGIKTSGMGPRRPVWDQDVRYGTKTSGMGSRRLEWNQDGMEPLDDFRCARACGCHGA